MEKSFSWVLLEDPESECKLGGDPGSIWKGEGWQDRKRAWSWAGGCCEHWAPPSGALCEIFWNPAQSGPTWRWGSWAVYQLPVLAGWGLLLGASTCLLPSTPACPACLGPEKALEPKETGTLSREPSAGLRRVSVWDMRLGSCNIWCWPQTMFHPVIHDFNKPFYYGSWCVYSTSPLNLTIACCCCSVTKSCPTLCDPHGLQYTRLLCLWDFPGKNTGVGCHFLLPGDLSDPRIKSVSPALAGEFLPLSHLGSPNRTIGYIYCFYTLWMRKLSPSVMCPGELSWGRSPRFLALPVWSLMPDLDFYMVQLPKEMEIYWRFWGENRKLKLLRGLFCRIP